MVKDKVEKKPKKIVKKKKKEEVVAPVEPKKVIEVAEEVAEVEVKDAKKKFDYLYAVGRRKTSIAQVRVFKKGEGKITINKKDYKVYFPTAELQDSLMSSLRVVGQTDKLDVVAKIVGGGVVSQAEAVRHGVARALLQLNPNFKKPLKKAGYLTRDPRRKERKKPGLKGARKAPQWSKR